MIQKNRRWTTLILSCAWLALLFRRFWIYFLMETFRWWKIEMEKFVKKKFYFVCAHKNAAIEWNTQIFKNGKWKLAEPDEIPWSTPNLGLWDPEYPEKRTNVIIHLNSFGYIIFIIWKENHLLKTLKMNTFQTFSPVDNVRSERKYPIFWPWKFFITKL